MLASIFAGDACKFPMSMSFCLPSADTNRHQDRGDLPCKNYETKTVAAE